MLTDIKIAEHKEPNFCVSVNNSWQGLQYVNGTFVELENVDVEEIRELLKSETSSDLDESSPP